jgi:hypothetical protein
LLSQISHAAYLNVLHRDVVIVLRQQIEVGEIELTDHSFLNLFTER